MQTKLSHIWIERMTVSKYILLTLQYGWRKETNFFYNTSSRLFNRLSSVLYRFTAVILEKGVPDKNNRGLIYKIEEDTVTCIDSFFSSLKNREGLIPKDYQDYQDEWLRVHKSHAETKIKDKISFLYRIDCFYRDHMDGYQGSIIIYLDKNLFARTLKDHLRFDYIKDIDIRFILNFKNMFLVFPFPGLVLVSFAMAVLSLFKRPQTSIVDEDTSKGIVFEEYISNIYSHYPEAGHLFWHEGSGLDSNRVILYFDSPDSPLSEKSVSEVKKHNMKYLEFPFAPIFVEKPLRTFWSSFRNVALPKRLCSEEMGLWGWTVYYLFQVNYYRQMYRKFNCRMVHQHQEFNPSTLLRVLALRCEDGIFIWNHWSVDHFAVAYFNYGMADLIFSWGPYNDGYFQCQDFSYRSMIQTGIVAGDNITEEDKKSGKEIRSQFSSEVKFVITVLDTSCAPNVQNSIESVKNFYRDIFSMVDSHPNWSIVIKTKGDTFYKLNMGKDILDLFEKFKDEKRCLILDKTTRVSIAASVADVSLCYGINSAGIVSALAGIKAIHWDLAFTKEHPLYYLGGENKVIFKTKDQVEKALSQIESGDQSIGNHDAWLKLFDAFCDDQGRHRAGKFINALLNHMNDGLSSIEALEKEQKIYAKTYGEDKVTCGNKHAEHSCEKLWRKVRHRVQHDEAGVYINDTREVLS